MKEKTMCLLFLIFMQCSSSSKEEQQVLKQAAVIHNAMVTESEAMEQQLIELAKDSSFQASDSIWVWSSDLEQWESELVEVPGNEAHHHKEGEHHHDHQQLNVTAAQMMVIQLELQRRLHVIKKRIELTSSYKATNQ